ncbi:MAG: hypothetical protein PHF18_10915 [Methanosarcina sp.]|uniref:hypothetical protein n=1 Tax=Methanosarcina sp. TaxID=2213 RepID=UPI0026230DF6|nr:hypothetical protein [Methanosarcina sp.]MDD3247338.1 hypothetical protein [Methanosarcina sp.]
MPDDDNYSRVIPVWKFALFSVASFGLYELYWNYKSWKFFKEKDNLEVSPFWRTIFSTFFLWSLFNRYSCMLKEEGYQVSYSVTLLVFFWIGMNFTGGMSESPIWLISFLSFHAFIPILNTTNAYWEQKFPGLPEKPLIWWQVILLITGTIFVFLSIVGTFIPE